MSTSLTAVEAAAILGVSRPTLYAYVSRGRLGRTTAPDGRTSLFDRDEVERLAAGSRRSAPGPRPTIDVQIRSAVTTMHDQGLDFCGHDAIDLAAHRHYEDVAELLWSTDPDTIPTDVSWDPPSRADRTLAATAASLDADPLGRMAALAYLLDHAHTDDTAPTAARRLLSTTPLALGSTRLSGRFALRLARAWQQRPSSTVVAAIDTAMALLADHELATSTLAVRIAASVRSSPYLAFATGLGAIGGRLHGSAAAEAHRFIAHCAATDPSAAVAELRRHRRQIPGFGHKVYRNVDPRFELLLDRVRAIDPTTGDIVDRAVAETGRLISAPANVDLALGALTWAAGLDPDVPIFAVARIAGWAAHYAEELDEAPVRFRGVAAPRR